MSYFIVINPPFSGVANGAGGFENLPVSGVLHRKSSFGPVKRGLGRCESWQARNMVALHTASFAARTAILRTAAHVPSRAHAGMAEHRSQTALCPVREACERRAVHGHAPRVTHAMHIRA